MVLNYLKSSFVLFSTILFASSNAHAQGVANYADQTYGTGYHKEDIIWLTWDHIDTGQYTTSGIQNGTSTGFVMNGDSSTFNLPGGGVLTATFNNIVYTPHNSGSCSNTNPSNKNCGYQPGDMMNDPPNTNVNTGAVWVGGGLQYGYNVPGKEALFSNIGPGPSSEPGQDAQEIEFDVTFSMLVDGVSIPVDVIFSDAETTNPSSSQGGVDYREVINATTSGANWQLIEHVRSTNYQATAAVVSSDH